MTYHFGKRRNFAYDEISAIYPREGRIPRIDESLADTRAHVPLREDDAVRADALEHARVELVAGARDDERHAELDEQRRGKHARLDGLADRHYRDVGLLRADLYQRRLVGHIHLGRDGNLVRDFRDGPSRAVDPYDVLSERGELFAYRRAEASEADDEICLLFFAVHA